MISRIGIVANLEKPRVREAIEICLNATRREGIEAIVEERVGEALELSLPRADVRELVSDVDCLVSFGGDGTFLAAARMVDDSGTPLLGINLGSLGFLTEVRVEEIDQAVVALSGGDYLLEKRRKVAVEVWRDGECVFATSALNDIVLNMGSIPRAIDLELSVEGVRVGRYLADGMIVATPTGSTAYNLSAGGPIVEASMDAMIVTPICPHTLGVRPLILQAGRNVEIRLHSCESGRLSGDGQFSDEVVTGDRILFPRADEFCYLLRLPRRNLFQLIQEKLRWGGLPRHRGDRSGGRERDNGD